MVKPVDRLGQERQTGGPGLGSIKDERLTDVLGTLHKLTTAIFSDAIQRKLILDNLTESVFTVDLDLRITSINKAAQFLLGISEDEALGRPCTEVFIGPSGEDFCIIQQALRDRRPYTKLTRQLQLGDTLLPCMVSASPLTDNSGQIVGGVQSFQEIQEIFQRQLVLDCVFDGVFTVDLDLKITLFNNAAQNITGFKKEDVLGRLFTEVFHPNMDRGAIQRTALAKAIETGRPVIEESVYITKSDGSLIPVSLRATPLRDARGIIIGGVQNFRDNTDRIQTNLILDHVVDGVFTTDSHGIITSFNKAASKITGYSQEEALGKACHDILQSDKCENRKGELFSGRAPKMWLEKQIYLKVKGGRVVPVSMSSVPILDIEGKVLGTVQTFRDITHQIHSQYVLDSVADGVFTVDENFVITSFNRAAERITGYSSEEALGKRCSEIFRTDVCNSDCPMVKAIGAKTKCMIQDIKIRNKEGKPIPVSICVTALVDDSGKVLGGVETIRDLTEVAELKKRLAEERRPVTGIESRSPKMQKILSVLPEFAKSDSTILILGESGTGKEVIAHAIHDLSPRRDKPFIAVNSGALPDTLLESELFGYKKGAFTDAKKDKKGRFAAAEHGTLFLDEIGDISPAMQVKLLRVLETKTYEPLGSNRSLKTDARIIAATNKNLEEMVKEGTFREDLYYRLNVVKIELPPLRERMEDLPLLVEYFIKKFNMERDRNVKGISEEALSVLMHHDYPGNIRELENIIEYAFILCHEDLIQVRHLPEWLVEQYNPETRDKSGPLTLKEIEKRAILDALKRNNFKKLKTCRELGISKDTLRRKLMSYGLKSA